MKQKIVNFFVAVLTVLSFVACDKKGPEEGGLEGKGNYITAFSLTVNGASYKGAVVGDTIAVDVPENVDLKNATVSYALSEGATINPDPALIKDWSTERRFIVTSKLQKSRTFFFTIRYGYALSKDDVHLATQADVEAFAQKGVATIAGNLIIGTRDGDEAITSLHGLSTLRSIGRALIINPTYKGKNMEGLEGLETIGSFQLGSTVEVSRLKTIQTINFPRLQKVHGNFIVNCNSAAFILAPELESIQGDLYVASDTLLSVEVNALAEVEGSCVVRGTTDLDLVHSYQQPDLNSFKAKTEAIFFNALTKVGGTLEVGFLPDVTGVYLPSLATVGGTLSMSYLLNLPNLVIPKLSSVGGLHFNRNLKLAQLEFSQLEENKGSTRINSLGELKSISFPLLKVHRGDMSLLNISIKELDFHAVDFCGSKLFLKSIDSIEKILGPEEFKGSIEFSWVNPKSFTLVGVSELSGSFTIEKGYFIKESSITLSVCSIGGDLVLGGNSQTTLTAENLRTVAGDVCIGIDSDSKLPLKQLSLPNLQEVGGSFSLYVYTEDTLTESSKLTLEKLESIGLKKERAKAGIQFDKYYLDCPNLKTINGDLTVEVSNLYKESSLTFPTLKTINGMLSLVKKAWSQDITRLEKVDMPMLDQLKGVKMKEIKTMKDYTPFKKFIDSKQIAEESQWSIKDCAYSPTFDNMVKGLYTKELKDKYIAAHPGYKD